MRLTKITVAACAAIAGFLAGNTESPVGADERTPRTDAESTRAVFEQIGNRTSAFAWTWGCEQMDGKCPLSTQMIAAELAELWTVVAEDGMHEGCYTPQQIMEITTALQAASDDYQLAAWHMTCE